MDIEPEGTHESLLSAVAQEKTAKRTQQLLVAARLAFVFSHGALVISASVALCWEDGASWWAVFLPVWLGDLACAVLIVLSWFASCPYIKLCLQERQARLGDSNPSILTDILPDIVMAILGLFFMMLAITAEVMFCRYLDGDRQGKPQALGPSAAVFIAVSILVFCRGICISTSGELFTLVGGGILASSAIALCLPGGPLGSFGWVLLLPPLVSTAGLVLAVARRLRRYALVLSREERLLRIVEQLVLLAVFASLLALVLALALPSEVRGRSGSGHAERVADGSSRAAAAAFAGASAGGGICTVAVLRARMAFVESRLGVVSDRLVSWEAAGSAAARALAREAALPRLEA